MRIILDTHAFLWLMVDDHRLSTTATETFADRSNEAYLRLASVWEMAIKSNLGKLQLPLSVDQYISTRIQEHGITLLNITVKHLATVEALPRHHKDPFDRLIISQGISENLPILSHDPAFDDYPIKRIW